MREFLTAHCPVIIAVITALEAIVTMLLFVRYIKKRQTIALLMAVVGVGLLFDALVMALGSFMPHDLLRILSRIRFVSHGLLVPLNIAICGYAMKWVDIKMTITWIITAAVCILGCASGFARVLELRDFAGIVRYVAGDSTPVWADKINRLLSFGTVLPVIAAGIYVWIKEKTPTFFLAGALMFVFAAFGPATGNSDLIFLISMFGELLMIFFFLLYSKKENEYDY